MDLAAAVLQGDRLALARLLTAIEDEDPAGLAVLSDLYPHGGKADRIGITGPPGSGKSSLVARLAAHIRRCGLRSGAGSGPAKLAVVAIDPSSPFTGGAILGDRIRMRDLAGDPGVFIRSMASRGALGGLAQATFGTVQALDAAGYQVILIETVGAGQAEVEIASTAHTTVVVEAPGMGDDVQAIKAGILEIADILVVNKADLPGADNAMRQLQAALALGYPEHPAEGHAHHAPLSERESQGRPQPAPPAGWVPEVLATSALKDTGIPNVVEAIDRHLSYLDATGGRQALEARRAEREVEHLLQQRLAEWFHGRLAADRLDEALRRVVERQISPRQAVELLTRELAG
ncbi:MAG: methylmalonyl Co-A mutase-associated GTPase MeaB [Anaerolineales bacterium]|nr:methylmalonyl Co-A mutase-associated GTPase MeaB [Anaerolineales bacterium]